LLTSKDMSWFAVQGSQALIDDGQIQRKLTGGSAYVNVGDAIKCAVVNAKTPQEYVVDGYLIRVTAKDIILPLLTEVLPNDRIMVKGMLYHIIKPYAPETWEPFMRVAVTTGHEDNFLG
jgi:hypothetical protein